MKLRDFKGLLRKKYLHVVSVENPHGDYYLIKLKTDPTYKWTPGEHASFSLPDRNVQGKKWRAFSIASVDQEGYMLIGTRTGKDVSSFKENLIQMKAGERIGVRGPFGWFKIIDTTSPLVLIASGVGITPIRALLKTLEHESHRDINLIYGSSDYYLFGQEIEALAEANPNISLYKTNNRNATQEKINDLAHQYENQAYYYVSGSMPMIDSTKDILKKQNIDKSHIINDPFYGY